MPLDQCGRTKTRTKGQGKYAFLFHLVKLFCVQIVQKTLEAYSCSLIQIPWAKIDKIFPLGSFISYLTLLPPSLVVNVFGN